MKTSLHSQLFIAHIKCSGRKNKRSNLLIAGNTAGDKSVL